MASHPGTRLKNDAKRKVVRGAHAGKSGIAKDRKTSKTGSVAIIVPQASGVKLKTLAKNLELV